MGKIGGMSCRRPVQIAAGGPWPTGLTIDPLRSAREAVRVPADTPVVRCCATVAQGNRRSEAASEPPGVRRSFRSYTPQSRIGQRTPADRSAAAFSSFPERNRGRRWHGKAVTCTMWSVTLKRTAG